MVSDKKSTDTAKQSTQKADQTKEDQTASKQDAKQNAKPVNEDEDLVSFIINPLFNKKHFFNNFFF